MLAPVLAQEIEEAIEASRGEGWVQEPEAKRIFSVAGLEVPRFSLAGRLEDALAFAGRIGYPVVGKVASPKILHKSDRGGVVVGIRDDRELTGVFERFERAEGFRGMLVEEMLSGVELIVGSKHDEQFGPVILLGMGGTGVEIYRDVSLRMAPLEEKDAEGMIGCLKARRILEGYRGSEPVNRSRLVEFLMTFSRLVMELGSKVESIDLNPVICSPARCVIADARIVLPAAEASGGTP